LNLSQKQQNPRNASINAQILCLRVGKIQLSQAVFTGFAYTGVMHAADLYATARATKAHEATYKVIHYDADGLGGPAAVQVALLVA
jgi:hypothetical protein